MDSHSVAATRLVWTAVILNNSETSGPLVNGRALKMYSLEVYIKSFGGERGVRANPLEPPLPTALLLLRSPTSCSTVCRYVGVYIEQVSLISCTLSQ